MDSEKNQEIRRLLNDWGWIGENVPKSVLEYAQNVVFKKSRKAGDLAVSLGLIQQDQLDNALNTKPEDKKILEWLCEKSPSLRASQDYLVAIGQGIPFYTNFDDCRIELHPEMIQNPEIARLCEQESCALLFSPLNNASILVFESYRSYISAIQMGRVDQQKHPIRKIFFEKNENLYLALSGSSNVAIYRSKVTKGDGGYSGSSAASQEHVWYGSAAKESHEKAIASLIDYSITEKINDISIEPLKNGAYRVLVRQAGDLIESKIIPTVQGEIGERIVSFLMQRSGANPQGGTPRNPRDGQLTYCSSAGETFLRLSFIPLNHPATHRPMISTSIRLLSRDEKSFDIRSLKLEQNVIDSLNEAVRFSQGLVLVVGPTNTGKSTTISAALGLHREIFGVSKKRISLENPIERYLPDVIQVNLPESQRQENENSVVETYMKAVKRHDPDVIWVGEIRDQSTLDLAIVSASSGHLVFSTSHYNDSLHALNGLVMLSDRDFRYQLIENFSLIIGQRLVRPLCKKCKIVKPISTNERQILERLSSRVGEKLSIPHDIAHPNSSGCSECSDGYSLDQMPINDVLPFTREVKDLTHKLIQGDISVLERLSAKRICTLHTAAVKALEDHQIDIKQVLI